jgi:DNA-binding GntR family transcriptional regulator
MTEPLSRTVSGQLAVLLRDRILTGTYGPGMSLVQDTIAAEFGVSKIPVREALVQLRGEGLIDIFSHRGFQVRGLSEAEFQEIFQLRLKIEPAAVAEGARRASDADRSAAKKTLTILNEKLATEDLGAAGNLNREFHLALIVPRLQPVTAEILGRLHTISQRYVQFHLSPKGRSKRATREHVALFESWAAGNAREVKGLIEAHIQSTRDDLAAALSTAK